MDATLARSQDQIGIIIKIQKTNNNKNTWIINWGLTGENPDNQESGDCIETGGQKGLVRHS